MTDRVWLPTTSRSCFSRSSPPNQSERAPGSDCRSATGSSSPMAARSATPTNKWGGRHFSSSSRPRMRPPPTKPMTERLYYTDPYARSFEASVVAVEPRDGRTAVFLDRTAFYPTSGGQPFDTGTIGGVRVVEVIDDEDGRIAHVIDASTGSPQHPATGVGVQ